MLERLVVENYALIRHLEMVPGSGLTIITGETGAGKSIMLGALSLLLGERADSGVITDKEGKSIIEASFSDIDEKIASKVKQVDSEWDGKELIIRREISATGRSRAFVNDTPVKLGELVEITRPLFEIHSQHSNKLLIEPESQLQVIDLISDNSRVKREYQELFKKYVCLRNHLRSLKEKREEDRKNEEFYRFQLMQLDDLNPRPGELEKVEKRFDMLSDAEEIRKKLSEANYLFNGEESGVLVEFSEIESCLKEIDLSLFKERSTSGGEGTPGLIERLAQLKIELQDIAETVADMTSEVETDPGELARVTKRMNELYEANKTFRITEPDGLVKLRDSLRKKLSEFTDENLELQESELRRLARELKLKAAELTRTRRNGAAELSAKLTETAIPLGLPNVQFEISVESGKLTKEGGDIIEFKCSFNKNLPMAPMSKIASGGELSRVMLSLRRILAGKSRQPTIIFDEIDAGVSGEIADKMGKMMHEMSKDIQVLTITHLPQVASKGDRHFKVFKHDLTECTISELHQLNYQERVIEIAGMLSGEKINEAALSNARALLTDVK